MSIVVNSEGKAILVGAEFKFLLCHLQCDLQQVIVMTVSPWVSRDTCYLSYDVTQISSDVKSACSYCWAWVSNTHVGNASIFHLPPPSVKDTLILKKAFTLVSQPRTAYRRLD